MAHDVQQLVDMGFAYPEAEVALREAGGNVEQALELLLTGAQPEPEVEAKPEKVDKANRFSPLAGDAPTDNEWPELPKQPTSGYAKGSDRPPGLDRAKDDLCTAWDLSMEDMVPTPQMPRPPGLPCGLLNVGNTCYVNSLLQTLFHAEEFRDQLLRFRPLSLAKPEESCGEGTPTAESMAAERRREHALQLVLELRKLFAYCRLSDRSCVSPSQLLHELVDLQGHQLPVGGQEDVSEFMLKFVDQLEEGIASDATMQKEDDSSRSSQAIHELLYGEQVQIFSYVDEAQPESTASPTGQVSPAANAQPIVSSEQSDFLQIFLDVKHKNLYAAWAAANEQSVDYTTPAGSKAKGRTRVWIRRLPKLLFFQLQRVAFDTETKEQVKLEDEFDFETTIFPDRFMQRNESAVLQMEETVQRLRERKAEKQSALQCFQQYQAGLPVTQVLRSAASCLEANAASLRSGSRQPAEPNSDPVHCAALTARSKQAGEDAQLAWIEACQASEVPVQTLRALADECQRQEERLQEEICSLDQELLEAYSALQKEPYHLFGIWVHQGQQAEARAGHYVAFLKDWRQDRWLRFSDSFVSTVSWEEVRRAALGGEGQNDVAGTQAKSRSSAYVLVYMEAKLAESQQDADKDIEIPGELLEEIQKDNRALENERGSWEEQVKVRELRQHAQAIFQEYAMLLHHWEPKKPLGDASGNPHSQDPNHRKQLNDPALMCIELYIYKSGGEQEVFHYLLKKSLDAQRQVRCWPPEDEGRILSFLAETLRSQDCYVKMLREKVSDEESAGNPSEPDASAATKRDRECELLELDLEALTEKYETVLLQAQILDEALQLLKKLGGGALPKAIGLLSTLWAHFNLDIDYQFRHNEVLLVLSALMYNTVSCIEDQDVLLQENYRELGEYFYIVLSCVEWPRNWKHPLQQRISKMFPSAPEIMETALTAILKERGEREGAPGVATAMATHADHKQLVLLRSIAYLEGNTLEDFKEHPPAGEAFFDRHRALWSWAMQNDKLLAKEYVSLTSLS
ncbi:USP25 [Symbiodinium sp. CCMP2456]|nr:USP25 [Symbiodinium sp. CCMP2456]